MKKERDDKVQANVRHQNKCIQFQTADGVKASEILENEIENPQDEENGPYITKWRNKETELLVEGFPYTIFYWNRSNNLVVGDRSGEVEIDGDLLTHASGMHGLS